MKTWEILFRVIILLTLAIGIGFNVLLYNFCEKQRMELNSVKDKQDVEAEFNSNKFKYEQDQIESLSKDLVDAQQQIREQSDALAAQKDESKNVQTSLVDIAAEADAIKQDIKGWQKDYVTVLVGLEKKMDESQAEIKSVDGNINSLKTDVEKLSHPSDSDLTNATAAPDQNSQNASSGSL